MTQMTADKQNTDFETRINLCKSVTSALSVCKKRFLNLMLTLNKLCRCLRIACKALSSTGDCRKNNKNEC